MPAETLTKNEHTATLALLACGIVPPLLYLITDVIAGMRWEGYSFRDQTISELNAIGAPTRTLTIALGLVAYTFMIAFGVGVWKAASLDQRLRVAGATLVVFGALSLLAVPFASMHVREADESLTDTLHLVGGGIAGLLLLVIVGFGASAFGTRFRVFSIAMILLTFAFTAWSGMDGAALTDNLATPWIGVKERIGIYSYQLWLLVFAIALIRQALAARTDSVRRQSIPTNVPVST